MITFYGILLYLLASAYGNTTPQDILDEQKGQPYWKEVGRKELLRALEARKQINEGVAKNVILFIGDGMGPNTVTAARIFRDGESSSLSFENFPNVGLLKTYAVDATVPDSACTATAIFSGVKTNFEVVGVDAGVKLTDCQAAANKSHHLSGIMTWAQDSRKATGFVTTTRVTHATPSSLYAHSADRRWECETSLPESASQCKDIGRQLVEDEPGRNLQVIMGGGHQVLKSGLLGTGDKAKLNQWACARDDGDLIQKWKDDKISKQVSYKFIKNTGELRSLNWDTEYVMGIFSNSHMPYEDQRDTSESGSPTLAEMTKTAIEVLKKNENGYVLMVEGGTIDLAHHVGKVSRAMVEAVRFHEAVQVAQDMTNPADTLIIVTADHAHGLTINGHTKGRKNILGGTIDQAHHRGQLRRSLVETVKFHEAIQVAVDLTSAEDTLIIVTADHAHGLVITGKGNPRVDIMGNTIPSKADGVPMPILAYMVGPSGNFPYVVKDGQVVRKNPTEADNTRPDYAPQAGMLNDEVMHGGVDVNVYAKGPWAHLFNGVNEQTFIAHVIAYAARIGEYKYRDAPKDQALLLPVFTSTNSATLSTVSSYSLITVTLLCSKLIHFTWH